MRFFTTHSIALVVAIFAACSMASTAQTLSGEYDESTQYIDSKKHNKWHNSQNFKNALILLNETEEDGETQYDEAIAFLENEIKQHPANGYALCNLAIARAEKDYADLRTLILELLFSDTALDNEQTEAIFDKRQEESKAVNQEVIDMLYKGIALIPEADKPNRCKTYIICGDIQKTSLENAEQALADYEKAAAIMPCYQSYNNLFKYYIGIGDTDNALNYASKLGSKIDDDNEALLFLAKTHIDNNDYENAMTYINKAIANAKDKDDTDSEAQQLLVNVLTSQGKYQEAIDHVIEISDGLSGSDLFQNLYDLYKINDNTKAMVLNKLHQLEAAMPSIDDEKEYDTEWNYFEGMLYYVDNDYSSALKYFNKALERLASAPLMSAIADCNYMLGDAPQALKLLRYALRMPYYKDNVQSDLLSQIINIESKCGMNDELIYDSQIHCKAFEPSFGYNNLARGYFNKGQYAQAVETYNKWSEIDENNINAKYMRAFTNTLWGKTDIAHEELQEVINRDDCSNEMKMFALFYLGETEQSKAMLEDIAQVSEAAVDAKLPKTENDMPTEVMSFYNLACAYSLHGDIDRALHFLKRHYAEEENATDFNYAILDDELNNARKDPRFMEIINRYKQLWLNGNYQNKNNGK